MKQAVQLDQKAYVKGIVFGEYHAGKTALIAQLSMGRQATRDWVSKYMRDDQIPQGAPERELRALGLKHFVEHQDRARRLPVEIESPSHRWVLSDTRGHRKHFANYITSICGSSLGILVVTPEGIKVFLNNEN